MISRARSRDNHVALHHVNHQYFAALYGTYRFLPLIKSTIRVHLRRSYERRGLLRRSARLYSPCVALSASLLRVSLCTAGSSEKLTPQVARALHEPVVYMAHGVPGFKSRLPHYGRFSAKVLSDQYYNIQLRRPAYITGRTVEGQRFATRLLRRCIECIEPSRMISLQR